MDARARLIEDRSVDRLWARDTSLFADDPEVQKRVAKRLGWLGLSSRAQAVVDDARHLGGIMAESNIRDILLLGMGGSSLAPLVMSRILPSSSSAPKLTVVDTSSPRVVQSLLDELDPKQSALLVASKSGSTIEPLSLYSVFRQWLDGALGPTAAGFRCIALTDRGTSLEELARAEGFRDTVTTPSDVGGRYSALSAFGLFPVTLAGIDAGLVADRASVMEAACQGPVEQNPGALLAAWMIDAHAEGRDKLTLVASDRLRPFGMWVEQLVAESTGKSGMGFLPVSHAEDSPARAGETDRLFAVVRLRADDELADWAASARTIGPVHEIVLEDVFDIGAEFVRWEVATALAGSLMGIDPFDEPNVTEAKNKTEAILEGASAPLEFDLEIADTRLACANATCPHDATSLADAIAESVATIKPGEFLAVLAYVPEDDPGLPALRASLERLSQVRRFATVVQVGPRYLHSTGQLHKGGPGNGVFFVFTESEQPMVDIPGKPYTMADLFKAQAGGDMATLSERGRRVVMIESASGIGELGAAFDTLSADD